MLSEKFKNHQFLLASKSPRRQELLKVIIPEFSVVEVECDENYPPELRGAAITDFIAQSKSAAYHKLKPNEILITADTIVWFQDNLYGKPKNKEDAFRILTDLSGQMHEVFSSMVIKSVNYNVRFSERTEVYFDEILPEEINFYLDQFQPFDKAGSYGIQDWLGCAKISGIKGDFYNVMGLPLRKLYRVLSSEEF